MKPTISAMTNMIIMTSSAGRRVSALCSAAPIPRSPPVPMAPTFRYRGGHHPRRADHAGRAPRASSSPLPILFEHRERIGRVGAAALSEEVDRLRGCPAIDMQQRQRDHLDDRSLVELERRVQHAADRLRLSRLYRHLECLPVSRSILNRISAGEYDSISAMIRSAPFSCSPRSGCSPPPPASARATCGSWPTSSAGKRRRRHRPRPSSRTSTSPSADRGRQSRAAASGRRRQPRYLRSLQAKNPRLKVLLSVGGWEAEGFSDAAAFRRITQRICRKHRRAAARALARRCRPRLGIPGPKRRGHQVAARGQAELHGAVADPARTSCDAASRDDRYLLTIASADREYFDFTQMDRLHVYLDWINVMTYDFFNSLTPTTVITRACTLRRMPRPTDRNADASIKQHLAAGIPPDKLVLGVAFYGRGFAGVKPEHRGVNQPYERFEAAHPYSELVDKVHRPRRLRARVGRAGAGAVLYGTRRRAPSSLTTIRSRLHNPGSTFPRKPAMCSWPIILLGSLSSTYR